MFSDRHELSEVSSLPVEAERAKEPVRLKIHRPDEAVGMEKPSETIREPLVETLEELPQQPSPDLPDRFARFPVPPPSKFVYSSILISKLMEKARRYARTSASILVTGESGTGKELISRFIHAESCRSDKAFIAVNCAALPELIAESELFGHERGAFTGAFKTRMGHFENADKGTLLLDEISEVPVTLQAKLLRAIEEQEVQRLGASQPIKVDVRIIATSNRNLQDEVKKEKFRLDLYHRLGVLIIEIPPLRQRAEDIPELANHYVQKFGREGETLVTGFTPRAISRLCEYHWPGNIRELRNVVHTACIECTTPLIDEGILADLPQFSHVEKGFEPQNNLAEIEKKTILHCLERNRGKRKETAAELGVTTRTLSNKLKNYAVYALIENATCDQPK